MTPFDESALPEPKLPSVAEATSDGLMLAEHAGRMTLKNIIIVGALRGPGSYDAAQYLDAAAGVLAELAEEFEQDGERVARALRSIENRPGRAARAHDYRSADTEESADAGRRAAVARRAPPRPPEDRPAPLTLADLIESARKEAWADVSRVVQDGLDRSAIVVDPTPTSARTHSRNRCGCSPLFHTLVALAATRDRAGDGGERSGAWMSLRQPPSARDTSVPASGGSSRRGALVGSRCRRRDRGQGFGRAGCPAAGPRNHGHSA